MKLHPVKILLALFACSVLFLGRANRSTITEYGFGDDDDYWAYGRSLVYDGDFDFSNEPLPTFQERPSWKNYHSPIPGLFWTPAIALGRLLSPWIEPGSAGAGQRQRLLVSAFSSALTFLGLLLLFRFLRHFFEPLDALLASTLCLWSSPLMFFTWRRPLMAHSVEFLLLSASALALWHYLKEPTRLRAVGVGTLLMLAALVRYTNVFMVMGLVVGCLWQAGVPRVTWQRQIGWNFAGALWPLVLQLYLWHGIYGQWLPPSSGQYSFSAHNIVHFLGLSSYTLEGLIQIFVGKGWGLLWMEPAVWLALLGVMLGDRQTKSLRFSLSLALIPLLIIAANFGSQGGSYGYRYLLVKALWLSVGAAAFLTMVPARRLKIGLVAACCAISIFFLTLYASGPEELTLSFLPGRDGILDWVNTRYALNAVSYACHAPQQILLGLSGSPLLHTFAVAIARLSGGRGIPASLLPKLMIRINEVPLGDLWWYVGWQLVFAGMFYGICKRFKKDCC